MKKICKFFAFVFIFSFCTSAHALQYPFVALCTGDSVRIREDPGTDGKILGKFDSGAQFVVLDEIFVDGGKWYEIDNPNAEGNAFIFAKYVEPEYQGEGNMDTPAAKIAAEIRVTFGITRDKALAVHGEAKDFADGPGESVLDYEGFKLTFIDDRLQQVEAESNCKLPFGDIKIGDTQEKLLEIFGDNIDGPDELYEVWTAQTASGEALYFTFGEDSKIVRMVWESPVG